MKTVSFSILSLLVVSVMAQPTAFQWNASVTAGWNLGNQLECQAPGLDAESTSISNPANAMQAETAWGNPTVSLQMFESVKDAGFNAVRIPVRWQCHITDATTMTIDEGWIQRVKEVVDYALSCNLKVIINSHHDKWLESRPVYIYHEENQQRLSLLWTQIATAFKDYDYQLAFAGTNEVHVKDERGSPTKENLIVQNSYNQTFVDAVRATGGNNAQRHLIVQTYACNPDYGLNGGFVIPQDIEGNDNNYLSVEVHYYNPWDYCGETTYYYWGTTFSKYGSIPTSNELTLRSDLQRMADIWGAKGLGIVMGEWGISNHYLADSEARIHENMTYYCKTLIAEARKHHIATFVWDNNVFGNGKEKFGIFNRHDAMKLVADWTMKGIQEATGVTCLQSENAEKERVLPCLVIDHGAVYIQKGDELYSLQGMKSDKSRCKY